MEENIYNYIKDISTSLIKNIFDRDISIDLQKYDNFLNEKRIKEIDRYRTYELISPQIYNLCYLVLTKEFNLKKDFVISSMETDVNKNKSEMRTISIFRYTPTQYIETKKREQKTEIIVKRHPSKKDGINWDVDEFERADFNPWRI